MKSAPFSTRVRQFAISLAIVSSALACHAGGRVATWGFGVYGQTTAPAGLTDAKAVAAGDFHSMALRADGTVVAWGENTYGQTNVPADLREVVMIAAARNLSLALKADGTVAAWGQNSSGQTSVPAGMTGVLAIATGGNHALALKADGSVAGWGHNHAGQATAPPGLSNVVAISAGAAHSLALKANGTVVAWGSPSFGLTNVPVNLSNVVAISAGYEHSLALKADGTLVAWGNSNYGETNVPFGLSNVVAIAAGAFHDLALKADGTLVAWGSASHGATALPPGLSNVTGIAAGNGHNLAIVSEGPPLIIHEPANLEVTYTSNAVFSVIAEERSPLTYKWFRNGEALQDGGRISGTTSTRLVISNAQFNDAATYTVVVSNAFGSVVSSGATLTVASPPFILSQSDDRTVAAGADVTLEVSANGTPPLDYQWFYNGTILHGRTSSRSSSRLGLFNVQPKSSGVYSLLVSNQYGTAQADIDLMVTNSAPYILEQPFVLLPNHSITSNAVVPVGVSVTFLLNARGSMPLSYQWRFNGEDIPGATNSTLALANLRYDQTGYYSVAVRNAFGEVISGKIFLNVVRVLVAGTPFAGNTNMPLGLSNVTALAAGGSHVMALKTDGTVRTWLANAGAIFDTGTLAVTNVPATAKNVIAISAGRDHCLALRSNGTVVAWGGLSFSQTNVPPSLSNVVSVAAGWYRSYAVKADGTVTGWGSLPTVAPAGLSNVVAIAAGPWQTLALRRDGTVAHWIGSASSFAVVPGLSNAIAIAASSSGNRALLQDGTVMAWPATSASQPTPVFAGHSPVSDAVAIAVGSGGTSLILKQDGTLVAGGFHYRAITFTNNLTAIAAGGVQTGFGVMLTGNGAPAMTLHPLSQLVQKGDIVRLHARAAGAPSPPAPREPFKPSMSFQWQHDGVNLSGATNASLTLSNVLGRDTGGYRLIASNILGMATSGVATITIPFSTNLPAALNATNLTWTTFSSTSTRTNGWFAQIRETHDGDTAAQSGAIAHNQQSILQTSVTGPGTLSFRWKVSSEAGYDFMRFYWNNSSTPHASISGETDWQQISITLGAGAHTLRWTYAKDATVSSGADAGWLDEVTFIPPLPVVLRQPFDRTVGVGSTVTMPAIASSLTPMTFQWLKSGTNLAGANAQYLTLTNVTLADAGTYALKVSNAAGSVISSNAVLTVLAPQPLGFPVCLPDGSVRILDQQTGGLLQESDASRFSVLISSNLTEWHVLPHALVVTNGHLMVHDHTASNSPARFYRLVEH